MFFPLFFLRRKDLSRQLPKLPLHDLRLHEQLLVLFPPMANGHLARFAPGDFPLEASVAFGQCRGVQTQSFITFLEQAIRLPGGPLRRFQRDESLGEEISCTLDRSISRIRKIVGGRE